MTDDGYKDVLLIGNQSRPDIFALNIIRPAPLYDKVIEIDERVTLVGYNSDPRYEETKVRFDADGRVIREYKGDEDEEGEVVRGLSGEAVRVMKSPGVFANSPIVLYLY